MSVLRLLRGLLGGGDVPDEASEADTDADGFLSYAWEWHALAHGLYLGLVTKPWHHPPAPRRPDVDKESHYYRGGYVLATSVQWLAIGVAVATGNAHVGLVSV